MILYSHIYFLRLNICAHTCSIVELLLFFLFKVWIYSQQIFHYAFVYLMCAEGLLYRAHAKLMHS